MIRRMATRRWRPLLLVALFLLMFIGSTLVEMQLPRWLRPLTTTPILFVGTVAILYVVYRLWGSDWQPGDVRPARQADLETPRPTLSTGRRAVAVGTAMSVAALLVTAGLVAATMAWSTGHLTVGPDDGPPWYWATMLMGGSAGFAVLSVITIVQTYDLRRTVAAVEAKLSSMGGHRAGTRERHHHRDRSSHWPRRQRSAHRTDRRQRPVSHRSPPRRR